MGREKMVTGERRERENKGGIFFYCTDHFALIKIA
jgi:hypothetical protein